MSDAHFYISREDSVKDVQDRFFNQFPHLRINLFKNSKDEKRVTNQSAVFCPNSKLKEINKNLQDGGFEIKDDMTVSQLENKILIQFGLYAQVSGKSGDVWLEPNMTLGYMMKLQNEHNDPV